MRASRRFPRLPGDPVVAVTGGGRGIGRATAEAFVAAGARVAVGDLDLEAAREVADGLGDRAAAFTLDVTSRESFAAFLDAATVAFGPLDVLVNNAGIMPAGAFLDEPDRLSRAQVDVNLFGPIHGMRLAAPGMVERGRGHIVNVASMAGRIPLPGLGVYCAGKYAVVGLSAVVRAELDGTGVSVTAVLPTAVRTRLVSGLTLGRAMPTADPADVAAAIVSSVDSRAAEISVPRWLRPIGTLTALVPDSLMRRFRSRSGADRALHADAEARAEYQRVMERQAEGR